MNSLQIYFIVGVGRSGTTLLQCMLHAHPEFVALPETHFPRRYVIPEARGTGNLPFSSSTWRERLCEDPYLQRVGAEAIDGLCAVAEENRPTSWQGVYERLLAWYATRHGVRRVVEKDPEYASVLPELAQLFPDAYVIHIIRDPRAVVASRLRAAWGRQRSFLGHVHSYRSKLHQARETGPQHFGERYLELRYEDLVREPAGELQRLCARLGISYHPAMLDFASRAGDLVAREEHAWKGNVFGPVSPEAAQRWRDELTARQVQTIEGACRQAFRQFSYRRSGHSRSGRWAAALPVECYAWAARCKRLFMRPRGNVV